MVCVDFKECDYTEGEECLTVVCHGGWCAEVDDLGRRAYLESIVRIDIDGPADFAR
jgi:hypothetical protein